ncbi:alpha/beta fold hydrolase [Qipengyuania sp. MTN3-11]|uniref:alpha/beta fold hydrolase n=1 Tax=Qipengyuania sp. MTN3-11 TaxID=3056557 RepID=UPI0036F421CB
MVELWQQRRIALANGIELDVVDEGPRDAPALIFLHGFPESHRTWRHQIAHFSDRFRCIAPDQRGYRGSSKPQEVDAYTPDKLIGDIFLLAAELGVGEFTVVGHDWGGAIAWGVAITGQKGTGTGRVARCVIANAPHPAIFQNLLYTDETQRAASQYMRGFRDPANDALVREHGLGGLLMQEIEWDEPDRMEPEERARLLDEWQDRDAAFAMLNWYRASPVDILPVDAPMGLPDEWDPPALPKLKIPTLVIWGQDDRALPPANTDGLQEHVEDLTLVEVPDCGHFVPWEAPEAVNAAMEGFLARGP